MASHVHQPFFSTLLGMSARLAAQLNGLAPDAARTVLLRCCGAQRWADEMVSARPFANDAAVFDAAARVWWSLERSDWMQAFGAHPRLGERSAEAWSHQEQAGVARATNAVRRALADGNREYEARFGHVFLMCATGRSADEMLTELRRRLKHGPARELEVVAGEQAKITRLRLEKLIVP